MSHTTIEEVRVRIADAHRAAEMFRASRGRSTATRRRRAGEARMTTSSPR